MQTCSTEFIINTIYGQILISFYPLWCSELYDLFFLLPLPSYFVWLFTLFRRVGLCTLFEYLLSILEEAGWNLFPVMLDKNLNVLSWGPLKKNYIRPRANNFFIVSHYIWHIFQYMTSYHVFRSAIIRSCHHICKMIISKTQSGWWNTCTNPYLAWLISLVSP